MYIKEFKPNKIILSDKDGNTQVITCGQGLEFDYDIIEKIFEECGKDVEVSYCESKIN